MKKEEFDKLYKRVEGKLFSYNKIKDDIEIIDLEIAKVNNDYVVTININKIDSTNQLYTVKGWYSGDNENTFSSKGSNTYIKGAFFNLPNENKLIC